MAAHEIFRIDFDAQLDGADAFLFSSTTGLLLSHLDDPHADVVGSHFIGADGERVMVAMSRLGGQRWRLEAFTHAQRWDMDLLAAYHEASLATIQTITAAQER